MPDENSEPKGLKPRQLRGVAARLKPCPSRVVFRSEALREFTIPLSEDVFDLAQQGAALRAVLDVGQSFEFL
jgi:hypothetical protein